MSRQPQEGAKGVKVVRKRLADGRIKEYRYQQSKPQRRVKPASGGKTFLDLIAAFERSPKYQNYALNTKASRAHYMKPLMMALQYAPIDKIELRNIATIRDTIARTRGPGAANGLLSTAATIFAWGVENGWLKNSPTHGIKLLNVGGHFEPWTMDEAKMAMAHLPENMRRAVILALHTGQRRGDLAQMRWDQYDGQFIKLRQQKTKVALAIPVHPALKLELDEWKSEPVTYPTILVSPGGRPWYGSNLSTTLRLGLSQIPDFPPGRRCLHGLRKLAAIQLAESGCTVHQIAAITGHLSLRMVQFYTRGVDQQRMAQTAMLQWTAAPNALSVLPKSHRSTIQSRRAVEARRLTAMKREVEFDQPTPKQSAVSAGRRSKSGRKG